MSDRPLRYCQECGGLDDHPRHVQSRRTAGDGKPSLEFIRSLPSGGPPEAMAQLVDPSVIIRHMDCCAALGCPDCQVTEVENEGRRGPDLIAHLDSRRGN